MAIIQDKELKDSLSKLNKKLDTADKMEAAIRLGCSLATVDRYLKGKIAKKGFAKLLVNQFNQTAA